MQRKIQHRVITKEGIDFIKLWEKLMLKVYDDGYGYLTIGYGHLWKKGTPQSITEAQALELLRKDLYHAESSVIRNTKIFLTNNEFDALVSFVFNCGSGAYQRSTLRQKLNRDEPRKEVANEFLKWIRAGGRVSRGLLRRRIKEAEMFLK